MKTIWFLATVVCVCSCSVKSPQPHIEAGPTIKSIYDKTFAPPVRTPPPFSVRSPERQVAQGVQENSMQKRDDRSRIPVLVEGFAFLENPVLQLFVFPHLTGAGTPVPGYTTFFKMYETDPIALPSEIPQHVDNTTKTQR